MQSIRTRVAVFLFLVALAGASSAGAQWLEWPAVAPDGPAPGNGFGGSIAVSGLRAVVGDPGDDTRGNGAGAVTFFERRSDTWVQITKAVPTEIGMGDFFGSSVAISGDYAVVGVGARTIDSHSGGVVYVYRFVGGIWVQDARLRPAGVTTVDGFGAAVAIDRDMIVIGAPGTDGQTGAVYVYFLENGVWVRRWTEQADAASNDLFGQAVAVTRWWTNGAGGGLSEYYIGVGAPGRAGGGAVYFLHKEFMTDPGWRYERFAPAGLSPSAQFGTVVAMDGYWDLYLVAGAPYDDTPSADAGRVFVYRNELVAGTGWQQIQAVQAPDAAGGDRFGTAVSVRGDTGSWRALVGAPYDDEQGGSSGAAYVMDSAGGGYAQDAKLLPAAGRASGRFGLSVALDPEVRGAALIGGPLGSPAGGHIIPFTRGPATRIDGNVWHDDNGDGVRDPEDENLASVTVFLDQDGDGVRDASEWAANSTGSGTYFFRDIPPGDYDLTVVPGANRYATTPAAVPVTLTLGTMLSGQDFGVVEVGFTPAGTDVTVTPDGLVELTFGEVVAEGITSVVTSDTNPGPAGSGFAFLGTFYDLATTAAFSGDVQVCLHYDDTGMTFADEIALRIHHLVDGSWQDATSSLDTYRNKVCATVGSFSWFALSAPAVSAVGDGVPPAATILRGAVPNPFNPSTSLGFDLARDSRVELAVYDLQGRRVRTLLDGVSLPRGSHTEAWDGRDDGGRRAAAGVYVCVLRAGGDRSAVRVALVK